MKNITSPLIVGAMLSLIIWSLSCASSPLHSPPALENRTLRLSPEIPGFEYQYEVCASRFLGTCTKKKMVKETYDLRDPEVRKHLIAMGFVLKVREKP